MGQRALSVIIPASGVLLPKHKFDLVTQGESPMEKSPEKTSAVFRWQSRDT